MAEKTRQELERDVRELSERLREQDRQLARFKDSTPLPPLPMQGKRPRASSNGPPRGFLDGLADALAPFVPQPLGLFELEGDGRVRSVGGSLCAALGLSKKEMIGTSFEYWIASDDRRRWRAFYADFGENHIGDRLSFRLPLKGGTMNMVASGFRASGRYGGTWLAVYPGRNRESTTDAGAVAKRWAGLFAHELNQPLAAVLTTAQAFRSLLASGKVLPDEMTRGIDALIRRVHHAADVVRRLRTVAGGEPPCRLPADLRDVVRRAFEVLQGPLADSGAAVTLDLPADFPAAKIDAVQVVQVVVNLVRNAIEAMNSLPVSQRQLTVRAQFDSREALVAVEDQGVGLSVDAIERLFQPLASTKATGMGLGLALCRQIVEAHGGRIWAKGNSPRGCVFSFSIPLESKEP